MYISKSSSSCAILNEKVIKRGLMQSFLWIVSRERWFHLTTYAQRPFCKVDWYPSLFYCTYKFSFIKRIFIAFWIPRCSVLSDTLASSNCIIFESIGPFGDGNFLNEFTFFLSIVRGFLQTRITDFPVFSFKKAQRRGNWRKPRRWEKSKGLEKRQEGGK